MRSADASLSTFPRAGLRESLREKDGRRSGELHSRACSEPAETSDDPLLHGLWEGLLVLGLFFVGLAWFAHLLG